MSTLAQFTSAGLIIPELRGRDAGAVLAELGSALHREGRVIDLPRFHSAVMHREQLSSTAMPPGWAIPHARMEELPQLSLAVGRSSEPLVWLGGSQTRVRLVFLFAVPESAAGAYLGLVSALARLSRSAGHVERLIQATDSQTILAVLEEMPLRQSRSAGVAG